MFKAVVGQAEGTDTRKATQVIIEQCKTQLAGLNPMAGFLFAADHFDHPLALEEIAASFPGLELAGCTSSGEMSSAMDFSQDSMCLMLFVSDTISMASGIGRNLSAAPDKAVRQAIDDALSRLPEAPSVGFIFPGMLSRGIETVLAVAHEALGRECKLFGGLPGANAFAADRIVQFSRQYVYSDAVSVLLFAGPAKVAAAVCNSWAPVGYRSVIEAVDGNHVKRIGGRTALQFFREAFGPYAVPLPEMPLAIFDDNERYYLRSAIRFDANDQSIEYATPIPEGHQIQLTEATPERILTDLGDSLQSMVKDVGADWSPQAAFLFSCTSRRWIMGLRTNEELALSATVLPAQIPIIGFYTFGEIAPVAENKTPKLHNCTLVTVLLGENESQSDACAAQAPPGVSASGDPPDVDLLTRKLKRARESQFRLEAQKESFANVLRRMNADLSWARHRIEEQNQILKQSLTLAQEVQQSLIPEKAPIVDGFEIAGRSLYCDETGGDYIDYLPRPDGLDVVVGDVSGHGIAAALLMTTARALLRMRTTTGGSPAAFVTDLNRSLAYDVQDSGRFMTLMYIHLDPEARTATWVRAGHEPGLHYSPVANRFRDLQGQGMALGVMADVAYDAYTTPVLQSGEVVVIVTDGITESRDLKGRFFGRDRLMKVIRKHADQPAASILEACLRRVRHFRAGRPPEDDETLVVIKVK